MLISYDVASLFTNVPLDETIEILVNRAFERNWFNVTHGLNLSRTDLVDLLNIATKDQLFQLNGTLYEQIDGVAMGSPLGPLLANVFLCSIEDTLQLDGKMPAYYRRYVDDTLVIMPSTVEANDFLDDLNRCHTSLKFTMEIENNGMLPFLGMQLLNRSHHIETKVYIKPTNTGLLLHHESHVDERYKRGLVTTMLDRAYRLSSSWSYFIEECDRLKVMFLRLKYPHDLINTAIKRFVDAKLSQQPNMPGADEPDENIRITIPFIDQRSADVVRRKLQDLSHKINTTVQPVFVSRKLNESLKVQEKKPLIINQQRVVYNFKCDSCDASYVGYTYRHLHERIEEHKGMSSSIGKHYRMDHDIVPRDINNNFKILKKCKTKFDCLLYEMLLIRERRPTLNVQSDSLRAKLFT
ncbi:hypothetical protein QZH41_005213 [Actinostola sp. cb2023]|nr:hypothetical protein QZH41_005213 [Actinostola sp. cb2023]